jgi:hypothetical protein
MPASVRNRLTLLPRSSTVPLCTVRIEHPAPAAGTLCLLDFRRPASRVTAHADVSAFICTHNLCVATGHSVLRWSARAATRNFWVARSFYPDARESHWPVTFDGKPHVELDGAAFVDSGYAGIKAKSRRPFLQGSWHRLASLGVHRCRSP